MNNLDTCSITLSDKPPQVKVVTKDDKTVILCMVGMKLIVGTAEQWQQLWETVAFESFAQIHEPDTGRAV